MRFGERKTEKAVIPTASMADIAFLLIIFFMVTTVFRTEVGLEVMLPKAEATTKLPKRNIGHIFVNDEGLISIEDNYVALEAVGPIIQRKLAANPNIIISLMADRDLQYRVVSGIFDQLRSVEAFKVSMATELENP